MVASEEKLEEVFTSLADATAGRTPFTLGFLGSLGLDGGPRIRAVILRAFDRVTGQIMVATNAFSEKVAEIERVPSVALTMYDDNRGVQLRIRGTASFIDDADERSRAWDRVSPGGRHLYASGSVPGTPLPGSSESDGGPVVGEMAFDRFAWMAIEMADVDWLDLSGSTHRRWRFTPKAGVWSGQEIVP
ncbi:pyridoxamine 5'-phosphate oxidase family protein [Arthrobacter sp. YN]|uniref:pyridoxamine 5'-phosphate oxidase family protein n=1 Tax=Arthrobacter sp. YN TaxID=2020486 RepID=UPI000B5FE701|nr:pyridoxamine 5'-phosphate oxidase family protein [Arthrobacter sp. YN]ASN21698.1 hypothetical protein CGK93_19985 [Arthrobacter sp. YN]